jgi:hypothetical protein
MHCVSGNDYFMKIHHFVYVILNYSSTPIIFSKTY